MQELSQNVVLDWKLKRKRKAKMAALVVMLAMARRAVLLWIGSRIKQILMKAAPPSMTRMVKPTAGMPRMPKASAKGLGQSQAWQMQRHLQVQAQARKCMGSKSQTSHSCKCQGGRSPSLAPDFEGEAAPRLFRLNGDTKQSAPFLAVISNDKTTKQYGSSWIAICALLFLILVICQATTDSQAWHIALIVMSNPTAMETEDSDQLPKLDHVTFVNELVPPMLELMAQTSNFIANCYEHTDWHHHHAILDAGKQIVMQFFFVHPVSSAERQMIWWWTWIDCVMHVHLNWHFGQAWNSFFVCSSVVGVFTNLLLGNFCHCSFWHFHCVKWKIWNCALHFVCWCIAANVHALFHAMVLGVWKFCFNWCFAQDKSLENWQFWFVCAADGSEVSGTPGPTHLHFHFQDGMHNSFVVGGCNWMFCGDLC